MQNGINNSQQLQNQEECSVISQKNPVQHSSKIGGGGLSNCCQEVQPAFDENNIAILLSANDQYIAYLTVVLQSIVENRNLQYNYDILVFTRDISANNQHKTQKHFRQYTNVSIRFYDVSESIKEYQNLFISHHLTLETYYRLLAPFILTAYDKILYLDCDIAVHNDLVELYYTDIYTENYLLAACKDILITLPYQHNLPSLIDDMVDNFPKDFDFSNYFQAGVILFNLKAFRESFTFSEIFKVASSTSWRYHDQDTLNYLAYKRVKIIDLLWNARTDIYKIVDNVFETKPDRLKLIDLLKEVITKQLYTTPYIIHYTGGDKVWLRNDVYNQKIWWNYAKHTPYKARLKAQINKGKAKKTIKKMLMPFVNLFFPRGSKRREKLKKLVRKG